jgi:hypothetical protein
VHHAQESRAGDAAGKAPYDARLQVHNECVAKALVHKSHALVVGREVGALAEMSKKLHIRSERIERVALFPLGKQN